MNIQEGIQHLYQVFLNMIFPKKCFLCKKIFNYFICKDCFQENIKFSGEIIFLNSEIKNICVIFEESFELFRLIKFGKYHGCYEIYVELISYIIKESILIELFKNEEEIHVVPVPLHYRRICERGYNQSEIIAQKLCNDVLNPKKYIFNAQLLQRIKYTQQQARLAQEERRSNLNNCFRVRPNQKIPESVLLIDDIYTTGTTLLECSKTLKKVGVKNIYAIVLMKAKL